MVGLRDVFLFHHHSSSPSPSADPQTPIFPLLPPSLPPQPPLHSVPATHHLAAGILPVHNDDDEYRKKLPEIQLWHQQRAVGVAGIAQADGEFSNGASTGGTTCQDCGNQAKKDCPHRRCRTCCKSRGFDCSTHVKSTWVSAARRRERQQQLLNLSSATTGKRPRLGSGAAATTGSLTSTSATTPSRSFDTVSSHQELEMGGGGLPGHVTAPAVFNCVRVTAVEDGEGEYAYQAVVKIGGRMFKGFLYNQGLDGSRTSSLPNLAELHLGDLNGGGCKNANSTSLSSILEATDAYTVTAAAAAASCSSGMLAAANYGNPIN
ncbi:LATERAL ROOT PRIMORDIUM 1 protein [Nymphaea thermarum]|nr:LATERAL ROOT PRIMORDIUM 1 protein [Nymphaea thermarum]